MDMAFWYTYLLSAIVQAFRRLAALTNVLLSMDKTRGAYGDEDFCAGEPRPDIPDTLYLLLEDVMTVGRVGGGMLLPKLERFEAEFEVVSAPGVGGVVPPP